MSGCSPGSGAPPCDHENPQETNYQYVDNEKNEQAFTCGKCRKYLITINRPVDLEKSDLDITAISLAHLDLLLQNQGFTPMAVCAWNTFQLHARPENHWPPIKHRHPAHDRGKAWNIWFRLEI